MKTGPIETNLRLLFASKDITEDLLPDLRSFSYVENEKDEADEISILLKDSEGKWADLWTPDGGETVDAYLSKGTTTDKGLNRAELYCGRFFIDSMRVSGSPRTFEIRAVSIPLNTAIRKKIKTKNWEGKSLEFIAEEKAKEASVTLVYDAEENPFYDRVDQSGESDLQFLSRLCQDAGLSIKVTEETIVIFDQLYYEKQEATHEFVLGESDILSWSFETTQSEIYRSCTVNYRDPKQKKKGSAGSNNLQEVLADEGETESGPTNIKDYLADETKKKVNPAVMSYTYVDESVDANGQEYVMKKRAKSIGEAKRLAKAKLRQLNLCRVTGSMMVLGDVMLRAGEVISCIGFGSFDGNFYIEQASHSVSSGGYTTSLILRRVNNNY